MTIKVTYGRNLNMFVPALLFMCFTVLNSTAQVSVAPEAGLNIANLGIVSSGKRISDAYSSHAPKYGIRAGGVVNYDINKHIYLEPGLFYEMTGAKIAQNNVNAIYRINTIELPVNADYKIDNHEGRDYYFAGVGVYIADNFSGKLKGSQSRSLAIGSDAGTDDIKPVDIGVGLNIGRVLKYRYLFRFHSQFGLSNLYPGGNSDNSIKTYTFDITIGYIFIGKKPAKSISDHSQDLF